MQEKRERIAAQQQATLEAEIAVEELHRRGYECVRKQRG